MIHWNLSQACPVLRYGVSMHPPGSAGVSPAAIRPVANPLWRGACRSKVARRAAYQTGTASIRWPSLDTNSHSPLTYNTSVPDSDPAPHHRTQGHARPTLQPSQPVLRFLRALGPKRGNPNTHETPRIGCGWCGLGAGLISKVLPILQSWSSFDEVRKVRKVQAFEKNLLQKSQPTSPITLTNTVMPH